MKFNELNEIQQAELRMRIHAYAHEISIASMHLGTPRLRDEVAVTKAISAAALVYSGFLDTVWDETVVEPETALGRLASDVRKDEELRQDDERKEIDQLQAAIEKAGA